MAVNAWKMENGHGEHQNKKEQKRRCRDERWVYVTMEIKKTHTMMLLSAFFA